MNIDSFYHLEIVRKFILPLPGVEEYSCFGTPAFRVNKKLLARLQEDGETLSVRNEERDKWIKKNSDVYFVTDHFKNYPTILIHLSKVEQSELNLLLIAAWKSRANKKQLKEYGESR